MPSTERKLLCHSSTNANRADLAYDEQKMQCIDMTNMTEAREQAIHIWLDHFVDFYYDGPAQASKNQIVMDGCQYKQVLCIAAPEVICMIPMLGRGNHLVQDINFCIFTYALLTAVRKLQRVVDNKEKRGVLAKEAGEVLSAMKQYLGPPLCINRLEEKRRNGSLAVADNRTLKKKITQWLETRISRP